MVHCIKGESSESVVANREHTVEFSICAKNLGDLKCWAIKTEVTTVRSTSRQLQSRLTTRPEEGPLLSEFLYTSTTSLHFKSTRLSPSPIRVSYSGINNFGIKKTVSKELAHQLRLDRTAATTANADARPTKRFQDMPKQN